ncbi:cytochrome c3 family protein [Anaeromyxobacter sp. PSR-1]|uniref:cytochrome c3 family protein n=1 Tax=Anaeromyxobacter sp. PSR-1 TaxID=1300915 RepID=UPI0005DE1417|nr:cytochrome c3 family protein [Anaeromyxobacter sp. PSR-1]GAO02483.1 fumarate reductase flavoprotein subunit [Anaeromyxobacter sp. PSR-1]
MNALVALAALALVAAAPPRPSAPAGSCKQCHPSWTVLPKDHPAVKGTTLAACLGCHKPAADAKPDAFSARLHRAHRAPEADCTVCHTLSRGRFGLAGGKKPLGTLAEGDAPLRRAATSWAGSALLDATHAKADVSCAGCHASELPETGAFVASERCLACHGPADALAKATEPAVHPDRNPHRSHLGEIDCTACHHAHAASENYCLNCHPKFEMKQLPGAPR